MQRNKLMFSQCGENGLCRVPDWQRLFLRFQFDYEFVWVSNI